MLVGGEADRGQADVEQLVEGEGDRVVEGGRRVRVGGRLQQPLPVPLLTQCRSVSQSAFQKTWQYGQTQPASTNTAVKRSGTLVS